jgi:acetyltransferase-like isoleucine patch superfamily enzyme
MSVHLESTMPQTRSTVPAGVHSQITDSGSSALRRYQRIVVGSYSLWATLKFELITALGSTLPGALGLWVRKRLYPFIFKRIGRGTVIGAYVIVRHPGKIELGRNVVIGDGCTLDARGDQNEGIRIGDNVIVGESSKIRCKNGDITIESDVGLGANAGLFAFGGNHLHVGESSLIGPYVYLGGTSYQHDRLDLPPSKQGYNLKGGIRIGAGCHIGANASVMDGVTIGDGCIVGAGAVVREDIPDYMLATPHQRLVMVSRK